MIELIIAVVAIGAAIAIGIYLGNLGNRETPRKIDGSDSNSDCQSACSLFQIKQEEACLAKKATESAKSHAENMRNAAIAVGLGVLGPVGVLIGVIITASIGATVASGGILAPATITAIVIASAIAVIAILILFPVVITLITAAVTAAIVASNKQQEEMDAVAALNDSRRDLLANCTTEEANACLNIPFSC
jgi:hypothetical protein